MAQLSFGYSDVESMGNIICRVATGEAKYDVGWSALDYILYLGKVDATSNIALHRPLGGHVVERMCCLVDVKDLRMRATQVYDGGSAEQA